MGRGVAGDHGELGSALLLVTHREDRAVASGHGPIENNNICVSVYCDIEKCQSLCKTLCGLCMSRYMYSHLCA